MADNPDIVCSKKNRKARSTNFSLTEIEIIKNQVKLHPILEAKHSNTVTNAKKQAIWLEIVRKVNAVGVAKRSLTEVKDKWRNMCREAKLKFTENRRQMTKTGGGPPPTPLSQTMQDVVDMYRDASSFHGIEGGIETSMPGCSVLSSMAASPTQTVTKDQHDMDIWQDACEDLPVPSQSPISASQAFIVMETPLEEPLSPPSPPKQPSSSLPGCSRDTRQYPYQGKEK
ncbi:nuclear apoptosis-inducing factor 1-like [Saccostrea echinata]|uniref:nuclear apoptosis-inducing factor 1-like n=1 Tax=Saccostrea echinata TaxID=191078 RepID=UPI002A815DBA|nr:nuclear apoptosis-inducing factor 1-like [Saccostrea echinata]